MLILITRDEQQINTVFKLAFAGFLCMGEFTYTKVKEVNGLTFVVTGLTRSDVTLSTDHVIIRLKRSKMDKMHQGISIFVASTGDSNCPV